MRDPVGTVRRKSTGLVSVQTSWSADGENVRIIDPVTGTAGMQTEDYVADWPIVSADVKTATDEAEVLREEREGEAEALLPYLVNYVHHADTLDERIQRLNILHRLIGELDVNSV